MGSFAGGNEGAAGNKGIAGVKSRKVCMRGSLPLFALYKHEESIEDKANGTKRK